MPFDIGGSLADLRQSKGLTLATLAERTGLSPASLSRLERNEIRASWEQVELIAKACGYVAEAIFVDPTVTYAGLHGGSYESISANILRVEAFTNTPQGGDAGHGGVTILTLEDVSSTGWEVNVVGGPDQPRRVTLRFLGDTEADTLIECLEFAAKTLRANQGRGRGDRKR